ncbi:hypothetical protein [Metarhizobium album]|uniref:hypothetical protein n=1 Tax=Metarhizobium album TaxID=2182425 RepID=UPI001FE08DD6|nr:hypothetical protein [Rhizobium album]
MTKGFLVRTTAREPKRWRALICAALLLGAGTVAAEDIDTLPATVTFVVSTGYWEDAGETGAAGDASAKRQGYYKLVSVRQPDRTAKVYLQQLTLGASGPQVVSSVEIEQLTVLKPYVTDIRPESSAGPTSQPGLFATVYLKTDPQAREAEGWTVLIDDLGEMTVERATN